MIDYLLIIPIAIAFFVSLVFIPLWIKKARDIKLEWNDVHKNSDEKVAGSGGLIAILAFVVGVLVFIAYRTFFLQTDVFLVEILAMLTVVVLLAGIGFIDDLFGWQKGGMRRRHRLVLAALAAIPLMAINAGRSDISIPLLGSVDLGIVYPLILIPLGIMGAATTFNFLAGFNGLEAGLGVIVLSGAAIVAFLVGATWLSIISLIMVAALLGFLIYNFYPAKIFPGDSLTYAVGGLIAIMAILANSERIFVWFFIPFILETLLKSRGGLVKQSFGKIREDNTLGMKYSRIYGLTHLAIWAMEKLNLKVTEKRVVYSIWAFQILVVITGFLIFGRNLF